MTFAQQKRVGANLNLTDKCVELIPVLSAPLLLQRVEGKWRTARDVGCIILGFLVGQRKLLPPCSGVRKAVWNGVGNGVAVSSSVQQYRHFPKKPKTARA